MSASPAALRLVVFENLARWLTFTLIALVGS